MGRFAGAIHPDLFLFSPLVPSMLEVLSHGETRSLFQEQAFELGVLGSSLGYNSKGSVVVALDGVIQNEELWWNKLKKAGLKTRPTDQASLVASIWEFFQEKGFKDLDGEFAIAIWDKERKSLILIRDRIGKRPLYWYRRGRQFLFASELKALMITGVVPQTVSTEGMAAYLALGYLPQDITMIEGVSKLLPGYFLEIDRDFRLSVLSYWSYSNCFINKQDKKPLEIVKELEEKLLASLKRDLPEDSTTLGAFVSGGLGSASIAWGLSQEPKFLTRGLTTYFEGQNEEDLLAAETILQSLDIKGYTHKIDCEEFVKDLTNIIWHLDDPLADPNVVATWNLCKMTKDHNLEITYSGMGSDEFLVGHSRYTLPQIETTKWSLGLDKLQSASKRIAACVLQKWALKFSWTLLRGVNSNPYLESYIQSCRLFTPEQIESLAPDLRVFFDTELFLQKFHHLHQVPNVIDAFVYLDVKTRLPDLYIQQFDRLASAWRVDWRAPFVDRELVEYSASIPEPSQLGEAETAALLKMILKNKIPDNVLLRPKRSRRMFLAGWAPRMRPLFEKLLTGSLVETGWIRPGPIKEWLRNDRLISEYFKELFSLLVLEIWFQLYVNRPIGTEAPGQSVEEILNKR